jgi:hypothetical protein
LSSSSPFEPISSENASSVWPARASFYPLRTSRG